MREKNKKRQGKLALTPRSLASFLSGGEAAFPFAFLSFSFHARAPSAERPRQREPLSHSRREGERERQREREREEKGAFVPEATNPPLRRHRLRRRRPSLFPQLLG